MFLVRGLWRLIKAIIWIVVVILLIPVVGLAYGFLTTNTLSDSPLAGVAENRPPIEIAARLRAEIPNYQRPEESTFLTYPEWAIVYAAREYAGFVARESPSEFPYWSYIGRFWQDYAMVIRASSDYPFNFANHQMLAVIGTSHTIEHILQWAYENTVGRLTVGVPPSEADRYLAGVAADYAAFLDQVPWYEYDYAGKRAGLMEVEPATGMQATRTTERQYAFGFALTVKQAYADLIKSALAATADPALLDIHVWAKGPVSDAIRGEADTALERDLGEDGAVLVTKRYQVFTDMIPRLIARGVRFVEIGGNDEILVTVLSNDALELPEGARELFAYPLPARPETRRTGLKMAVSTMHVTLPAILASGARLEHVYDY